MNIELLAYRGTPVKLTVKAKKTTADIPAVQLAKEREDKQQAAVVALNEDPNIQALKGHFDARHHRTGITPEEENTMKNALGVCPTYPT